MKISITKRFIDSLKPTGKDTFVWDATLKNFGLKLTPAGSKIYVLQYRQHGRVRRYTIGIHGRWTLAEARKKAQSLLGELAEGKDLVVQKAKVEPLTLSRFAERYLSDYAELHKKQRSIQEDRRNLNKHVLPVLGKKRVEHVTKADIVSLHHGLRKTPVAGNRVRALLVTLFNLAEEWGIRPERSNPCHGIRKYKEQARQRYLSDMELATLGEVLRQAGTQASIYPPHLDCIRLLIFTGARKNELVTLQWKDVDLRRYILQLPDSKTGFKIIHLNPPALEILTGIRHIESNPYVFPGIKAGCPIGGLQNTWKVLRERAGLHDVHLHDLRHSYARVGAGGGLSLPVIGGLLGHAKTETTQRYSHLVDDPSKKANDFIGEQIHGLMNGQHDLAQVVSLEKRKKSP